MLSENVAPPAGGVCCQELEKQNKKAFACTPLASYNLRNPRCECTFHHMKSLIVSCDKPGGGQMRDTERRVALIYDARHAYDLQVMAGVASYIHDGADFNVYLERDALKDQRLPDFRSWDGNGIIANFDNPSVAMSIIHSKLPTVGFGSGYGWRGTATPYFFTNNEMIASMAADHFSSRGFRHFAFCGYAKNPINGWSGEREEAFVKFLDIQGFPCNVYVDGNENSRQWTSIQRSLAKWLGALPKPVGVLAANDSRAHQVLEACRSFGLRVPEEVAVIGVNNDELLCQLCNPALTSIEHGTKRMGYEAATLLDRLMSGKKSAGTRFVVDPVRIVTRQSTDILAIEDGTVAKAMSFIQEHAMDGIKVPNVVTAMGVSRSRLEARFTKAVGCTPRTAIRRIQLERIRQLISGTSLPLKQIAATAGFRSVQHMTRLFGKTFHQSPGEYRKRAI
jgi:LacI family transcriptional regulator